MNGKLKTATAFEPPNVRYIVNPKVHQLVAKNAQILYLFEIS